jgi:hypothetical protein
MMDFISWDKHIPNIWKNSSQVPNHQPDNYSMLELDFSTLRSHRAPTNFSKALAKSPNLVAAGFTHKRQKITGEY